MLRRRIAGWTALEFPWNDRPLNEEELVIANSHDMPPAIDGMDMEALPTFIEALTFAGAYGYDPQTDYRTPPHIPVSYIHLLRGTDRKGTMIHPNFQKRGFGTYLTQHCNSISDKTGGKTWVLARPTSVKMFRQCGFKDVATHNADLKRFGGNPEKDITWLLVREAPN